MRLKQLFAFLVVFTATIVVHAQFDVEESHTTASLRGIDTAEPGVAWASGANGTVLRTEDAGFLWQPCSVPQGAEKLDFRGVQAFNANTAVIMSSGSGAASRLYRTTDGCQTWKLVFTNPDQDGFFDALRRVTGREMRVLGDPVQGKFAMFVSRDGGATWARAVETGLEAEAGDGAFAASNSSLLALGPALYVGTGGTNAARVYVLSGAASWAKGEVPIASHAAAAGVFSLAGRATSNGGKAVLVAVGGIYDKPLDGSRSAAASIDGGNTWRPATSMPGGYRSSVAYDAERHAWIAVGTDGADVSRDDGRTWHPLGTRGTAEGWNALALPYVVGAKGRIGRLRPDALQP